MARTVTRRRALESHTGDPQPSGTAELNAAMRAAEARRPPGQRIFNDPFAHLFLRRGMFRGWASARVQARLGLRAVDRLFPGIQGEILLRARYADQALLRARRQGTRQIVLLGAGYDSTALRHDLSPATLYEVDFPATQAAKRQRLEEAGAMLRTSVVWVPCDFERDSVGQQLRDHDLSSSEPCLVIWLGVSYYLSLASFDRSLEEIGRLSQARLTLVLDYMDERVIDGTSPHPGAQRAARWVAKRGEPYVLGFTPESIERSLGSHGFQVGEHLSLPQLAERYQAEDGVWCRTDGFLSVLTATAEAS